MKSGFRLKHSMASLALGLMACTLAYAKTPGAMTGLTPKQLQEPGTTLVGHSDPSQMLRLVFGLEHPHLAEEKQFLQELHTKGSPNFQHFLTAEEWNKRFAPSAQDEQAVVDWANAHGLTVNHRFANRMLVDVEAPVAAVERTLGVTINRYQVGTKSAFANDRDPVLPPEVGSLIHSVGGLNNIQSLRPMSATAKEPAFTEYAAGPALAKGAVDGANATAKRPAKQTGPKANITNNYYDPTDLYNSQAYDFDALNNLGHCCNPTNNPGVTPPSSSIAIATAGTQDTNDFVGFHNQYPYLAYHYQQFYIDGTPACCDEEGTMDFEWATAMANSFGNYQNTAMVYMYDGVNANFSTFTDIYNQILSDGKARIFSTSWGCEELACTPSSVMDTDDGIFAAMVGQGWTLAAASGDQGATAGCGPALAVQYPASDPNIVGAGGTTLQAGGYFSSETGWQGGTCVGNGGGSTGGFSAYYGVPSYQSSMGFTQRAVPDISLNASIGQNIFYGGVLTPNGGTSIVAPEVAGFFAQTNAYLDYVASVNGGCYGGTTCSPIGNGNWYLYYFGKNTYAPHYPFYDIVSGCNSNDVTAYYGLGYYCAGTGYDEVTGWGSFNALQLAWGIVAYRAGEFGAPTAAISSSATPGHWYNTDQWVQWSLTDTSGDGLPAVGVSGFTKSWNIAPTDSYSLTRPASADGYFTGPVTANASYGYEYVSAAGQGCNTAYVRTYDNSGSNSLQSFGPVCYDTVPPTTAAALSGAHSGSVYTSAVKAALSASDAHSGVAARYISVDGGAYAVYGAPISVATPGVHTVKYFSRDVAGNNEAAHSVSFDIKSPTTLAVTSSLNPSTYGRSVTLSAKVTPSFGSTATGTVTFKDGATTLGTATLSSGKATLATSALPAGADSITAVYNPTSNDLTSTSTALVEHVSKAVTATTLVSSLNPAHHGTAVTFTATIVPAFGGATPGTVTFKNGTATLGTGAVNANTHKATFTTAALTVGTHSITAVYGGGASLDASTSAALKEVVK